MAAHHHAAGRLAGGEAGAHREAAADALGRGQDVGRDARPLVGEELAGAADAGLDLVHDEQEAVLVAERPQGAQPLVRDHPQAALALDRLDHQGGGLGRDRGLQGLQVAERHLVEAVHLRAEAVDVLLLAAGRDGGERPAVERTLEGDDPVALRMAAGGVVLAGHLDAGLVGLGTGIGEEHHVGEARLDEALGQPLGLGHLEHQFVMHLQQHPHMAKASGGERGFHADHGALDDVGAGPLDRRVDRGALGPLALALVAGGDTREMRLAAEQGLGEALLAHRRQRFGDVAVDAGEPLEIAVDHRLRFVRRHVEATGQTPARNAVEDGEVDRLGAPACVAIDLAEQLLGGQAVDIVAVREGVAQCGHVRHMRGQPQLDLRIVGGDQDMAGLGDKRLAQLPPDLGADRNVLKVWFG